MITEQRLALMPMEQKLVVTCKMLSRFRVRADRKIELGTENTLPKVVHNTVVEQDRKRLFLC